MGGWEDAPVNALLGAFAPGRKTAWDAAREHFKTIPEFEILKIDRDRKPEEKVMSSNQRKLWASAGALLCGGSSLNRRRVRTMIEQELDQGIFLSEVGAGYAGFHIGAFAAARLASELRGWSEESRYAHLIVRHGFAWLMAHAFQDAAEGDTRNRRCGFRLGSQHADGWAANEALYLRLPCKAGKGFPLQDGGALLLHAMEALERAGIPAFSADEKDVLRGVALGTVSRLKLVPMLSGARQKVGSTIRFDTKGNFDEALDEVWEKTENVVAALCVADGVAEELRAAPIETTDAWQTAWAKPRQVGNSWVMEWTGFSKRSKGKKVLAPEVTFERRRTELNIRRGQAVGFLRLDPWGLRHSGGVIPGLEPPRWTAPLGSGGIDEKPGDKPTGGDVVPEAPTGINWVKITNQVGQLQFHLQALEVAARDRDAGFALKALKEADLPGRAERFENLLTGKLK